MKFIARMLFSAAVFGVCISSTLTLQADTLELRNGSTLQGAYEGGTPDVIRFNFNGSTQEYQRGDVASLTFSKEPPAGAVTAATVTPQSASETQGVEAPISSTMEIPAGTALIASIQSPLNSGSVKAGQTFPAILVSDVRVGENVVLTSGTQLQGQVVTAHSAGRGFRKNAELSFTINAINYKGQLVAVRTSSQQEASKGGGVKDTVGGAAKGAALGAIFGAITGDAGDGAAGGAAAGGAGGFIRKGDNIEYQSGSVLAFTLESPVNL